MKSGVFIAIALIFLALIAAFFARPKQSATGRSKEIARSKPPLTEREIGMFFKLSKAFPQPSFIVMPQVSFSALITARTRETRNRFDRKTADFVICNSEFKVLAAVELDDASHNGREVEDAERDKLLTDAGYTVLRYKQIPNEAMLTSDMSRATAIRENKQLPETRSKRS